MERGFYAGINQQCKTELKKYKKKHKQYSYCRAVLAIAICLLGVIGYINDLYQLYIFGGLCIILFVLAVLQHNKIEQKQQYYVNLESITEDYISRIEDTWGQFPIDGKQYLCSEFPEARDLDIFGNKSIYQYICCASTIMGQDQLALWLHADASDLKAIKERQEAVIELASKIKFCLQYETLAIPDRKNDYDSAKARLYEFLDSIHNQDKLFVERCGLLKISIWAFPTITLMLLGVSILGINRSFTMLLFFIFAIMQFCSVLFAGYWNNRILAPINGINKVITPYKKLIETIEEETFESIYLKELQQKFNNKVNAVIALKELENITESVNSRHNLIAYFVNNALFLHDFHCVRRYTHWKKKYQSRIEIWLKSIGEMEALISLCVISNTKNAYVFPKIKDDKKPWLAAENLMHPLINEENSVGNDIVTDHKTNIVTGSNMSGKTTFIRSIGVNLILAYAGSAVTSQSFEVSLMKVHSSIRIEDSVSDGISTFYSELLRIKQIVDYSKQSLPMIVLIDEIYKGTNSKDRIIGARETVKKLSEPHILTFLTTHDFELCDLESESYVDVQNYHFSEYYDDNKILFDYKMRDGRCQTTNAQYLLKMAGIF